MAVQHLHVVPYGGQWRVQAEGSEQELSTHRTQEAAIKAGRTEAKRRGCELKIHGEDGKIRDFDTYGSDPTATRIFLGVQIECAQCHDHPFDRWSQDQFWNQAAFFSGLKREGGGLFAPLSESLDVRTARIDGTERYVSAAFLDGSEPDEAKLREAFAGWIASGENPYFAKAAANRVWSRFFGRGLVEPIDDFRADNPASHPELLDELAQALIAADFDLDYLARAIGRTKAYQRTSAETDSRQSDPKLFARMVPRGLTGEQFFDSLVLATGYDEANARRSPRSEFVARFGSTVRASAPETSIPQALALRNGGFINQATSLESGRTLAAACETPGLSIEERIELLYVSALSRRPTEEELSRAQAFVTSAPAESSTNEGPKDEGARLAGPLGDLFWTLLVSAEFRLNH